MGDVNNWHMWEKRQYEKSLFSAHCCCEPKVYLKRRKKIALKNKF